MKKLLTLLLTALLLLGSLPAAAFAQENDGSDALIGDYVPGEAIVCVREGASARNALLPAPLAGAETLMGLDGSANANSRSAAPAESLKLVRSDTLSTAELIDELQKLDTVEFAEPNYIYTGSESGADSTVAKDLTGQQWAYNSAYGMAIDKWNAYAADGTPDPAVNTEESVVAVLDSGVDYNHEDLKPVMWTADADLKARIGGGDHGCTVVAANSADVPYDPTDPMDDFSHGTHCAGIIAAAWNQTGVSGATSGAKIMAVKAINDQNKCDLADTIKGYAYIERAVDNGVHVVAVNDSWGGISSGQALSRAVSALGKKGVVSVFAPGNASFDCDTVSQTVSTLRDNPYVIAVNATDKDGNMASFSNFGATTTDVAAPGVDILSTVPTSMGKADPRLITAPFFEGFEAGTTPEITFLPPASGATTVAASTEMPFEGSQSLKVSTADTWGRIQSQPLDLSKTPYRYLSYMFRADSTPEQTILASVTLVEVKTTDTEADGAPKWQSLKIASADAGQWGAAISPLPDNTDYANFQIRITTTRGLTDHHSTGPGDVYIDNLCLGNDTAPYAFEGGTSMAAPAVTGEVAIVAKAFDEHDAAKTAARVIGSVKKLDSQKGKSVSEGLAQVDLALNGNTVPVLNAASVTADGQLSIDGYFFGNSPTVTIDGETANVVSATDEHIAATLPQGMEGGLKRIEVTTDKGSGHQSFSLGAVKNLYERLPLPDDPRFYDSFSGSLTGLGGSLYYAGVTLNDTVELWRYTPGQAENNGWTRLNGDARIASEYGCNACTWDGKLVIYTNGEQEGLGVYDPQTDTWSHFTTDLTADLSHPALVNDGSAVLLVGGDKDNVPQTSIIRVDMAAQTTEKIGDLTRPRVAPAVAYTADGSVYVAAGKAAANGSIVDGLEKIADGQCTLVRENVLPQGLKQNQDSSAAFGTIDGGMILSGPVVTDTDSGQVTADTYTLNFAAGGFEPTGKIVNTSRLFGPCATAYRNTFYVLGETNYAENNRVFSVDRSVKTLPQPGEEREKPIDPVNPVNPATPDSPSTSGNASTGFVGGNAGILLAAVLLAACAAGLLLYRKRNLG